MRPPLTIVTKCGQRRYERRFWLRGELTGPRQCKSAPTSAAIAAPTIARGVQQGRRHHRGAVLQQRDPLVALRLMPPPAMSRSGQIAFSIAMSTEVTSSDQRS